MRILEIGQKVWGYTGSSHTICGTDYQQYGEVTRLEPSKFSSEPMKFKAKRAGNGDGTGFEDYYKTQQKAMVAVGLPLDIPFEEQGENIFKVRTAFDQLG